MRANLHSHDRLRRVALSSAVLLLIGGHRAHGQERSALNTSSSGDRSRASLTRSIRGVTFEFVRIPSGEFLMGSQTGDSDEKPVHRVRIHESFDMGKTEVTVRQFRAFVQATGYETEAEKGDGAPG